MSTPALPATSIVDGRRRRAQCSIPGGAANRPPLKWLESFETGHEQIDAEHRRLLNDCNALHKMLIEGASWPLILAGTRKLVANCVAHSRSELAVLDQVEFPRRKAHAAEHRRLEQALNDLLARMEAVDGSLAEHRELPASLGPALVDFMIRHDLDYRSHLLHRGR